MSDDQEAGYGWDEGAYAAALSTYRAEVDRKGRAPVRPVAPGMDDRAFAPHDAAPAGAKPQSPSRFELVRAGEMPMTEPEFIVHGLLETSVLALAFGEPGCGKSFLALDLAACLATGAAFHGRAVKGGAVVYVAGEGHHGLRRRLEAWQLHHGISLDGAPLFISRRPAQFLDSASARAVADAVDDVARTEGPPVLIVVDTLARNFGPGDENSTAEMGAFVAALDDLKARYPGCTVLIVHHSGHGDKNRARGAMALKGALDAEFAVNKTGDTITLTSTKLKDAPEPPPIGFTLRPVEIGRTRAGEPITSAVLVEAEATTNRATRLSPTLRRALDTFIAAKRRAGSADDPAAGVPIEDWRAVFYEMSTADTAEAKRKDFERKRKALVESGYLAVTDNVYRLGRVPE